MKNLMTRFLFLCGLIIYLALLGNRSGAPSGRTGAPNESTCASVSCHNTTINSGSATINLNLNEGERTYIPGQTHKISISIEGPQATTRNGFEIVALDAQDNNIGEWILTGEDKRSRSANSRDYVTHTNNGSAQSAWAIDWKAPDSDRGAITFYLAYNDANNNGGRGGDNIYTTTLSVDAAIASSLSGISSLEAAMVFPNPVKDAIHLKLNLTEDTILKGTLFNSLGQSVEQLFQENISTGETIKRLPIRTNLAAGLYYLELSNTTGGVKSITILKE